MFEAFRQADGGISRREGGTGLGLAIVADIVGLHGGEVTIGDSPLGGAAFVVGLPVRAPAGTEIFQSVASDGLKFTVPTAGDEPEPAPVLEPMADTDRPLVLVVEDNREMNAFVTQTLSSEYRVKQAFGGREGVEMSRTLLPDLIVSDVMMPEVTGDVLVREIRQRPELDATPIVLLSARADDQVRLRLLREGAQDYLTKPFSPEELRTRVRNLVAMKRTRDVLLRALDTTQGDVESLATQITERNIELENALAAARLAFEEAAAASRSKSDFVSVMSHELRTPLNGIVGYVDLLEAEVAGPLNEPQQDYVKRVRRSAEHLRSLIEEVLTFARIEAGADEPAAHDVELGSLVREAGSFVEAIATRKGLEVRVREPERPVLARSDPGKLRQILLNLAGNAVKFTNSGVVTISAAAEAGFAVLRVEDTGPGIPPEHLERIFEPFWQGDPSRTRVAGGTGLGLAITRRLVDLLGAEILVESEVGRGTLFTVRLPMSERGREGAAD